MKCVNEVAAYWWLRRPELIGVAHRLFQWAEEDHSARDLVLIERVWRAAIRHNVLDYTGSAEPAGNREIDLLSWTITHLRHHSAGSALGEYHTPPEVAELLSRLTLDGANGIARIDGLLGGVPMGGRILDPAAGTGGLLRGAAVQLAESGRDPSTYEWFAQELDPLSAGACAVNFIVWGLGPRAMVACGDTLAEGDLYPSALKHRREMERRRDDLLSLNAWGQAASRVEAILHNDDAPSGSVHTRLF